MIFVVGYMAAGKSTLAWMQQSVLGWRVADTDELLEQQYGCTCAEMIQREGLAVFRQRERDLLEELNQEDYDMVATGGGLPCSEENIRIMKQKGEMLYLRWSPELLVMRLFLTDLSQRPLVYGKDRDEMLRFVRQQLAEREPYYMQADRVMECDWMSDVGIFLHLNKQI